MNKNFSADYPHSDSNHIESGLDIEALFDECIIKRPDPIYQSIIDCLNIVKQNKLDVYCAKYVFNECLEKLDRTVL